MEHQSFFTNLSPLDHRYYLANRELFDKLKEFLSEEASIRYCVRVEAALLRALVRRKLKNSERILQQLETLEASVTPDEVYREEENTQHNIRALVHVIKKYVPEEVSPLVHLGATSVDILDTSRSMRIRDAVQEVLIPLLSEVESLLIAGTKKEAETLQVGRTHGQHAVPITFGFALAEYVSRLGKTLPRIRELSGDLRGKLSGAVGAYNATSVLVEDPEALEREVLDELGLKPSDHSTQLVEPEHVLRLLLEIQTAFGVLANLADDLRHLQRSEIDEVREMFSEQQVGSSTMPQKRNPWNSEHVKSLWKTATPMIMTAYMDQISEHQRDLTNSASSRFVSEYLALFAAALNRMKKILSSLKVHHEGLKKNLSGTGDFILAEAAYIVLAAEGEKDAHEIIRRATGRCRDEGISLTQALKDLPAVWSLLEKGLMKTRRMDADTFFSNPAHYTGLARKKADDLAAYYEHSISAKEA
ncbi:MAG: adenylosuccinate lyase [Spirochaetales bacterium]|nr:adenylosuccinate lyase [Spirochaetales bacterium]